MNRVLVVFACIGLFLAADSGWGHHSFTAEFDPDQPVTLKGVITKVEWKNPHFYFYLDVKDESGKVTNWAFAGFPPNTLLRVGVKREMLKEGTEVTVDGWRARDGSFLADANIVTLPDGKKLNVGPAAQ